MFSAGKSKFINSIMRYNILPENQLPTTSIPTYITRGNEKLSAYTFNNIEVQLDYEAINAISHIFYEEYSIFYEEYRKCENDIALIIENTKQILKNTGLNVFGVAAYSSVENKEYFNDYIKSFIEEIHEMGNESQSVIDEVEHILNKYEAHFEKNKDRLYIERNNVYKSINEATDLSQIINLARLYSDINKDFSINNARMREFKKVKSKILDEVISILNNERYKRGKING